MSIADSNLWSYPLTSRTLTFITDVNGVIHLRDDDVAQLWLSTNHPTFDYAGNKKLIHYEDKSTVRVIDCTTLSLTWKEINR